jgi:cation:H+ antiporter
MLYVLIMVFVASLLLTVGASAWFTRRLEFIGDHLHFSPGLLSGLAALGANIPNYVAALSAAISGQAGIGIGIIIGSNIYNIAVILGISAFASPARQGMTLSPQEAQDAQQVGGLTLTMMVTTALAVAFFSWKASLPHQAMPQASIALLAFNLLTLGIFGVLAAHALRQPKAEPVVPPVRSNHITTRSDPGRSARSRQGWETTRALGEMVVALCLALGGVIVMVQTGQTVALDIHLPPAILSLIVLAIATSLPNTVVALTLTRTGRASASVEEVFSSNSVNAALGIALPLLFWSGLQSDRFLVLLDGPLMLVLTALALLCVRKQHVSRAMGLLLLLVYLGWIMIHVLL